MTDLIEQIQRDREQMGLVKRLRFGSLTTMGAYRMNLEAADRIEELEAKLSKAVRALKFIGCDDSPEGKHARTTLAEIGESNE